MTTWVIKVPEPDSNDPVELWSGRKRIGTHENLAGALRRAHERMESGDLLYQEDHDGYLTKLKGERRGWRK